MTELDKQISELEITVKDRYKDNPSTTERAFDKEYIAMLKQLRQSYQERNSPGLRDNLGWNASDARRVIMYDKILEKLEEESRAVAELFCVDPFR